MGRTKAFPHMTGRDTVNPGMDLRDWFAGQMAMALIIKGYDLHNSSRFFAKECYQWADALIHERNND